MNKDYLLLLKIQVNFYFLFPAKEMLTMNQEYLKFQILRMALISNNGHPMI